MPNDFSKLSAESEISKLAQIQSGEFIADFCGSILAQSSPVSSFEIIEEQWGTKENPDVRFCVYRKGETYSTPIAAYFTRENAEKHEVKKREIYMHGEFMPVAY